MLMFMLFFIFLVIVIVFSLIMYFSFFAFIILFFFIFFILVFIFFLLFLLFVIFIVRSFILDLFIVTSPSLCRSFFYVIRSVRNGAVIAYVINAVLVFRNIIGLLNNFDLECY
jgi:hypothetical protein